MDYFEFQTALERLNLIDGFTEYVDQLRDWENDIFANPADIPEIYKKVIIPLKKYPVELQPYLLKHLLEYRKTCNRSGSPSWLYLEKVYSDMETPKTQKPTKPTTINPAAEKVEFKHFSESFNLISDWQEIKTQLIERKFLSESGKWIDFKNGHKATAAGLIKWVALNGYCQKTKFTWQEIQAFCIDDFGIDEISERTIKGSFADHPDLYWLHSKT